MILVTRENVVVAALKLPRKQRAELASLLIRSLDDSPEAEWEEVWAVVAGRRLGKVRDAPRKYP